MAGCFLKQPITILDIHAIALALGKFRLVLKGTPFIHFVHIFVLVWLK